MLTSSEAKQIKLSERIQMFKAYENHPLKSQYLKEKEELKKDLAVRYKKEVKEYKKSNWWKAIPFVMIVFFFGLFWYGMDAFGNDVGVVVVLGILNLIICGAIIYKNDKSGIIGTSKDNVIENSKEYKEFTERYKNLGLVEVTEYNLTVGDCVEYDNVKCGYVCGATGCPLTYEQIRVCRGMSRDDCSKFYGAVYGANALDNAMRRGEF